MATFLTAPSPPPSLMPPLLLLLLLPSLLWLLSPTSVTTRLFHPLRLLFPPPTRRPLLPPPPLVGDVVAAAPSPATVLVASDARADCSPYGWPFPFPVCLVAWVIKSDLELYCFCSAAAMYERRWGRRGRCSFGGDAPVVWCPVLGPRLARQMRLHCRSLWRRVRKLYIRHVSPRRLTDAPGAVVVCCSVEWPYAGLC